MYYKDIRENIKKMANDNYKDFIKAIVGIEKGIDDEKALEEIYDKYMENDTSVLLSEGFDYMIDEMKEQGKIVENENSIEEKDDLVNLVGNIVGEVKNLEKENANGEKFKVSNFSVVSKDEKGNKIYTRCSAYGEKAKDVANYRKGDFVKIFGQVKTFIDNNGKEYKNVRILSTKLLKTREQLKKKNKGKKSILGQIGDLKSKNKENIKKLENHKGVER
ncbi:DNA-binding protein [Tissierellia bacterium S5-A11]|nr:DNA-binding protein [Tissierellia bacterium S5-A11]